MFTLRKQTGRVRLLFLLDTCVKLIKKTKKGLYIFKKLLFLQAFLSNSFPNHIIAE